MTSNLTNSSPYHANFFPVNVADQLFAAIRDEVQFLSRNSLTFKIFGKTNILPRDKAFYGDVDEDGSYPLYRYSGNSLPPTVQPWTPVLRRIRDDLAARTGFSFNHVVVNRYRDGDDHIGFHHDKVRDFVPGAPVCTLSFGGTRDLVLKNVKDDSDEETYALEHGSLFVLDSETNKSFRNIGTRFDANTGKIVDIRYVKGGQEMSSRRETVRVIN